MKATVTTMVLAGRTLPFGCTARTVPVSWWERWRCTRTLSPSSCRCRRTCPRAPPPGRPPQGRVQAGGRGGRRDVGDGVRDVVKPGGGATYAVGHVLTQARGPGGDLLCAGGPGRGVLGGQLRDQLRRLGGHGVGE